ncbi:flagellar motor protein MotA [Cephaloticoccus capnophilus]|uniref:Flagellar motor protein MotA n=1 Tax=Cephaloticoccus capnophilus TaxID=1548208 RepID=A0A139SIF3_9BACT|nr:MotA/TolQ/ExbB proton channel family protein [Cephaloticoccus capnophilus]KXU34352.1 flagellar motor protein MotA [Cephaloticoccus capnophilus]
MTIFAAIEVFTGAGLLIYPLGLCSAVAVYILCERGFALRRAAVMPQDLVEAVIANRPLTGGRHTVLARIVEFAEAHREDEGAVRAFARLEINRMERGIPYLDVIYAAAPLIGLTGTVTGLLRVFSQISPETGLPDPVAFTSGVALALSATVIGLVIAIPALVGGGWLQRRVENYAAQLDVLLERILKNGKAATTTPLSSPVAATASRSA